VATGRQRCLALLSGQAIGSSGKERQNAAEALGEVRSPLDEDWRCSSAAP
jgi:hypothetical protein